MKEKLIEYLACPGCKGPLALEVSKKDGDEVIEGILHCGRCNISYEIKDSKPWFLAGRTA